MGHLRPYDIMRLAAVVVGVADLLFLALFALDAFAPGIALGQQLVGLAVHLLPSAILALAIGVAWRWPIAGGVLLLLLATVPFLTLSNPFWVNAMLGAPIFAAGGLFLWSGLWRQGAGAKASPHS